MNCDSWNWLSKEGMMSQNANGKMRTFNLRTKVLYIDFILLFFRVMWHYTQCVVAKWHACVYIKWQAPCMWSGDHAWFHVCYISGRFAYCLTILVQYQSSAPLSPWSPTIIKSCLVLSCFVILSLSRNWYSPRSIGRDTYILSKCSNIK